MLMRTIAAYDNVYALISMPGIVDSLIHAFPGYDSVNDMVTYLMANLLNDVRLTCIRWLERND